MSGLNRSLLRSGVESAGLFGKLPKNGSAEPGGERGPGLFIGGLLGPGPAALRAMGSMLTRLTVCDAAPGAAIPRPLSFPCWKLCATSSSPSSSSCTVLGVFRSTAVESLWYRTWLGRTGGRLVKPREWELFEKLREGNAGVFSELSERSDDSWMSGRRSAMLSM